MLEIKISSFISVQVFIAGCINLGEMINGYGVGWSAPILPKLQNLEESPLPYLVPESKLAWIVTAVYFGCIGGFVGGYAANKIGRKRTLIMGGVINLISNVMLAAARSLELVYFFRFLIGCGMSMTTVTGLIYVGEIASPNIRGIIFTTMGIFHAIGGLLVYSVGPYVSYSCVGYVVIALNVLYVVVCYWLPESPMYYVIKNDEASAKSVFECLGQTTDINNELKNMIEKFQEQQQKKQIWLELFKVKSNRISLFIAINLSLFQQSSGIVAVILFATSIFEAAGSSVRPDIATIIVGATFVGGSCVSPMFIEKYGRRVLLMVSTAGCCVSMAVLGAYFYLKVIEHPYIDRLGWLPLASLVAAIFIYSVGLAIIPNTLLGELFTPKARGVGPSIGLTFGFISGFLSTIAFGYGVVAFGSHVCFWTYAVVDGLAFLFVIIFVPETKGKSLMEIQMMLEKEGYFRLHKRTKLQNQLT